MPKIFFPLRLVFYSLLLMPIWGLTLLDGKTSNALSIFVGLSFTFFSAWFWANNPNFGNKKRHYYLIFIGPVFYLLVSIFFSSSSGENLLSTIINSNIPIAFLFFCAAFFARTADMPKMVVYALFAAYFYAFHLRPTFAPFSLTLAEREASAVRPPLDTLHNLADFRFLTVNGDTTSIPKGKPVLIETWNESCLPCVASINDLQGFFEKYPDVRHIYLYENKKNNLPRKGQAYFYPKIKQPEKILIDMNLTYFDTLGMNSYPYFLMYDANGNLVEYFAGYRSSNKQQYERKLDKMLRLKH